MKIAKGHTLFGLIRRSQCEIAHCAQQSLVFALVMGCCFSCGEDTESRNNDASERSRLLGNPVSNNQARTSSNDDYGSQHSSGLTKGDEQSALTRILNRTSTSIIDVSALDSSNLEQQEYLDRANQYSKKITSTSGSKFYQNRSTALLVDVPSAERVLAAEPPSVVDVNLINSAAEKVAKALKEVKVDNKEDLVVHFGIP